MKVKKSLNRVLAFGIMAIMVLVVFSGTAPAAGPVYDKWDTSVDLLGWRQNTAWTHVEVVDTGGNPGGCLYTSSDGSPGGTTYYAGACSEKSELSGDFGFAAMIEITFDLKVSSNSYDVNGIFLRFRYQDSSHNGWRLLLTTSPSYDTWVGYTVQFDPEWTDAEATAAGWIQEPNGASFSDTMANVYTTEIRMEGNAAMFAFIDNFKMNWGPTTGDINDYIQNIPDNCFKNNPEQRKNAFENKLNAVQQMIDNGEYQDAINKLEHDIKDKVEKWITCPGPQQDLYNMIDELIAYLESLL